MPQNYQNETESIDLIEIIKTLWDGKWKIVIAIIISLLTFISYNSFQTNKFTAITEIKPLEISEINKYIVFNELIRNESLRITRESESESENTNFQITKISSLRLLDIYINILRDKVVFHDAIRRSNLIDPSIYNDEAKYNESIIKIAKSIKILEPITNSNNLEVSYHTINFIHDDREKWIDILKYSNELANKIVKQTLLEEYKYFLISLEKKKKYKVEDLLIQINNVISDYDRETNDRIAFLTEQLKIARTLKIAKNTIEAQIVGDQRLISNINIESPFYLRGYEAIEKEIEILKDRVDKKVFTRGLFTLEKEKRKIKQDKTKERISLELESTPLGKNGEFLATSTNIFLTELEYKDNKKFLPQVVLIGLIVGIIYILISSVFKSQTVSRKRS
jgi:LPS O-antigen subunit length determinant protein (WzzB/FepE family)